MDNKFDVERLELSETPQFSGQAHVNACNHSGRGETMLFLNRQ